VGRVAVEAADDVYIRVLACGEEARGMLDVLWDMWLLDVLLH
jgi:hypothetical protein